MVRDRVGVRVRVRVGLGVRARTRVRIQLGFRSGFESIEMPIWLKDC